MKVEVRKDGDVAQHNDPQEVEIGESDVPLVGHLN